jgi:hypothetical protein
MSAQRAREPRQPARIGARLRSGRGWSDVVIRNVSSRGLMGECPAPPVRGDYVEVRCGAYVMVARVAWAQEDCFGARAHDRIALPALIAAAEGRARAANDRRVAARAPDAAPRPPTILERAAASARLARALDFMAVAFAGGALASFAAGTAQQALAGPLDQAAVALAAGRAP